MVTASGNSAVFSSYLFDITWIIPAIQAHIDDESFHMVEVVEVFQIPY